MVSQGQCKDQQSKPKIHQNPEFLCTVHMWECTDRMVKFLSFGAFTFLFSFLSQTSCGMLGKSLNGFYAFVLFCPRLYWILPVETRSLVPETFLEGSLLEYNFFKNLLKLGTCNMEYWHQNSLLFKLGQLCADLHGRAPLKHKLNWKLTFLGEKGKIQLPGQGVSLPCKGALPMCEEEGVEQGWVKGSVVWGVKSLPHQQDRACAQRSARAKGCAGKDISFLWSRLASRGWNERR